MKIEWHQDLATGNPEIDCQHRNLFEKINDLIAACKEKRERTEIVTMLAFLKDYVRSHFSSEEQYQAMHGFPNQREHSIQHESLIKRLDSLEQEFSQEGASLPVVTNTLMLTYEWLTNHILKADLAMAQACKTPDKQIYKGDQFYELVQ